MAILNNVVRMAARRMPNVISPSGHAVIDYMIAGAFLATAGLFWKRNRRAAVSSLLCGGAHLGVTLLTDYPGGVRPAIPFSTRRKLDLGLAAMTAAMPRFLNFEHEPERKFFTAQSTVMTVTNGLTLFPQADEIENEDRRRVA